MSLTKVWRTGANEATVFEVDKDVKILGKSLPAGKYGLFTIMNGNEWTIIFNKTWKQWGAFSYKEADDALRVNVNAGKGAQFAERRTFTVNKTEKFLSTAAIYRVTSWSTEITVLCRSFVS